MPELREPLSAEVRRVLRRAVLEHALAERRARFLPLLHVGTPGTAHPVVPALPGAGEQPHDHAVRVDVLAALLARATRAGGTSDPPLVWLTRGGERSLQDVDARWLAAARAACAEADLDLTMVVVDRHGWLDPRSGTQVRWKRLRRR